MTFLVKYVSVKKVVEILYIKMLDQDQIRYIDKIAEIHRGTHLPSHASQPIALRSTKLLDPTREHKFL